MVKTFLIFRLAGFHVSSIDKIKQLHVALNVESLEVGKGSGTRKKV